MERIKKLSIFVFFLAVMAINLSFGIPRLARYSAVDEPYWTYDRTPDFWKAILAKKWGDTDINDKPGITVAEVSGLGFLSGVRPLKYESIRQEMKTPQISQEMIKINFFLRLPIYLTGLLILACFYFFLKKLFNRSIAVFSLIFIGLSPIILGISLIINPDSLLWGFLPLSILSFLIYHKMSALPEGGGRKYLIFSGIFLGLSLLTKYVANILYVFLFGLIFLEYIYGNKNNFSAYIKKALLDYGILILVSLAVFFALYPACWSNPEILLEGTVLSAAFKTTWPVFVGFIGILIFDLIFFKTQASSWIINFISKYRQHFKIAVGSIFILGIIFVFFNTYGEMKIFDFEAEMSSPKGENAISLTRLLKITASDLYALIFALTPLVFLSFFWAIIENTFQKKEIKKEAAVILYFLIFILLYYVASTVNNVTATVRYQIVIYPMASIIAGIGIYQISQKKKIKKYLTEKTLCFSAILVSALSLYFCNPYFFNYSSFLLPKQYILNLKDMGDGSFEAAQYLNSLPNAQNLVIWSDKGAVCETFMGKCNSGFSKSDVYGFDFSYFVVSAGRKSRSFKMWTEAKFSSEIDFKKLYMPGFPDADFEINFNKNINNFVRVVKIEKILEK